MNLFNLLIALFLLCSVTCNALKILAIFPYQGKSHFFVFKVYLEELAKRGHHVTVISYFPREEPLKNYHDISLAGSVDIIEDFLPIERSYWNIIQVGLFLTYTGVQNCDVMLENKEVQKLVSQNRKFDVIVMEQFNSDCGLGIAYKLKAPVVGLTSHVLQPWHYERFGIPYNPSYVSFHFLEGGTKPTLYQRVERAIFDRYFKFIYYFITQRSNQNTLAKYYDDIPPLEDLSRNIKFILLYHNFILTQSRLFPSNVIEVGGYHVAKAKSLTGELKVFYDESEHGVIYISFGSVAKVESLSYEQFNAILDAMDEFPQRFVWKMKPVNETLKNLKKSKLYISDWMPQLDILAHPKTKAFFSHSGMLSTTESIHYGVPMIAMPIFGDQPSNAASIEESGLGVQIQIKDLNKPNIVEAYKKVLNPEFQENVKQLSKAWHDRPLPPLDAAIFWTEFAARHSNYTFRTAAADVPWYQYMYLDVFSVLSVLLLAAFFIFNLVKKQFSNKDNVKTSEKRKSNKKAKIN